MSKLTRRMMRSIDYQQSAKQRRVNFELLHKALGEVNNLTLPFDGSAVPMVYPFLVPIKSLREKLIENKIFVARYWPNVLDWTTKEDIESFLAYQMQPLPIDQRYDKGDMQRIIDVIESYG